MRKSVTYSLLLLGITAISSQIILIRELFTTFYGNELSIGFILATWLFGGSIGSGLLGNFLADKIKRKFLLFSSIQFLLSILIPFGIVFARTARPVFGIGVGEIVSIPIFMVLSAIVLLPIACALGFLFVLGCKIISGELHSVAIGRVYTLEAIGSACGGTITSLVLIRYFGPLYIACMLSSLNLLAGLLLLYHRPRKKSWMKYVVVASFGLLFFILISGIKFLDKKSMEWKWTPFKLLESRNSIYGRTTVIEKDKQINFFNNGLFLFSSHDPLTAEETVHFPMVFNPHLKNILLIGGGSGEIVNEILKYPIESVDYIELDPLIISLSKKFLRNRPYYRLNNPRLNIKNIDGRYFIKSAKNKKLYDCIIVNMPNPYTAQINRFYTKEFFSEVKRIMKNDGILGFSVSSSENYLSKEQALFLKTLFETAKTEFAEVKIVPGDVAYFLCTNKKGAIVLNPTKIASSLRSRHINTIYVREYYLASKLSVERLKFLYSAIHSLRHVRKNMDFYPVCYFYDMVLWSTYFNFKVAKFFLFFTKKYLLLSTLGIFFVLFIVFLIRYKLQNFKKETTLLALYTTGLSEISFEILIILAFQIIYGYLYYQIGIIVTSFMFGLGFGSSYITKKLNKISRPFKTYIRIQMLVLIYPIILLASFKGFSYLSVVPLLRKGSASLFAFLPFIAGFVGGMQYPLANKICLERTTQVGQTAGISYAIDLLGAFTGAFLVSAFFVPLVGIPLTCILVSALNAISLFFLLMAQNKPK